MAIPKYGSNLHGTLTLASSGSTGGTVQGNELNLAIGTTVANGASLTSANIPCPGRALSCFFLVKMSSGTAVITGDTTSDGTTPSFISSAAVSVTVTRGEPVYVGPVVTANATQTNTNGVITTTGKTNVVAVKITNNSGAVLVVNELRLLSLVVYSSDMQWHDANTTGVNAGGPPTGDVSVTDGVSTFVVNT